MRRVFAIGDVPPWTTGPDLEAAARAFVEAQEDAGFARVFMTGNRLNLAQAPDSVAAGLRAWYERTVRQGRLTPP